MINVSIVVKVFGGGVFMSANASPFLVLWYLYVVFFGLVLIIHVLCKFAGGLLRWRVNALLKAKTQKD
jgi:hypothetical protein